MSSWKTPDEIIRLQRLKQRTNALRARIDRPSSTSIATAIAPGVHPVTASEDHASKRKNPFAKHESCSKRPRNSPAKLAPKSGTTPTKRRPDTGSKSASLLAQINAPSSATPTPTKPTASQHYIGLTEEAHAYLADELDQPAQTPTSQLPIDWGLKTKLRLLTLSRLTGNGLKTCQEASGVTGFVRCLNPQPVSPSAGSASNPSGRDVAADTAAAAASFGGGLDSSLGARFHQATMYWQHPHIPWLTLFPRNARANRTGGTTGGGGGGDFQLGESEREALATEWQHSLRALFQLLRARQCAYFYVCGNSYNALFCAAGIGGRAEQHAYLTPTSRGMRAALKQEEIEFAMPLKAIPTGGGGGGQQQPQNRSMDSGMETQSGTSFSLNDDAEDDIGGGDEKGSDDDDDDEDQDEWLASLGVEAAEIRKIGSVNSRQTRNIECVDDFSDHSLVLIEGVECQAFYNFLLHSKSTIAKTGRLAGVPPTVLAPVAFPGATLRSLQTRASQIRMDGIEYHSMELRGVVLPHLVPHLCALMRESKDTFSVSLTGHAATNAFSRAARRLMEDESAANPTKPSGGDVVFGRENLSDCGLPGAILELMCRRSSDAVGAIERLCFNKEVGGYTWN